MTNGLYYLRTHLAAYKSNLRLANWFLHQELCSVEKITHSSLLIYTILVL